LWRCEKEIGAGALRQLSQKADNLSAIVEGGDVLALVSLASEVTVRRKRSLLDRS